MFMALERVGEEQGPMQARLQAARAACQERESRYAPYNPAKMFSAGYLVTLAGTLTLDEVSTILLAERDREAGLLALRQGRIEEGEDLLARSHAVTENALLTGHALLAARTFHRAAVAYLHYRRQDFDAAVNALVGAIDDSSELQEKFGHRMEFRKIHLARNLIRVECFTQPFSRIAESTAQLVAYAAGAAEYWPIAAANFQHRPAGLADNELVWALDEILANLFDASGPAGKAPMEWEWPAAPAAVLNHPCNDIRAAWALGEAIMAAQGGDPDPFHDRAASFLELQSGGMKLCTATLGRLLDDTCRERNPLPADGAL